jgi:hypothetical protein
MSTQHDNTQTPTPEALQSASAKALPGPINTPPLAVAAYRLTGWVETE